MTIEATQVDRSAIAMEPPATVARASATDNAAEPQVLAETGTAVAAAVQQLQAAMNTGPNPEFKLDYLSGLSVVTVRSTLTGEVVFQLPDTRALELARMLTDGVSLASAGLMNATA